jgi:hypothetical protein
MVCPAIKPDVTHLGYVCFTRFTGSVKSDLADYLLTLTLNCFEWKRLHRTYHADKVQAVRFAGAWFCSYALRRRMTVASSFSPHEPPN